MNSAPTPNTAVVPPRQLALVIVNWNAKDQLRDCLDSLPVAIAPLERLGVRVTVVVVDNASTDGSAEGLPEHVRLVRNGQNRGFAAACNQGAALAPQAEWVLFLNPDTRLFAPSLSLPLKVLDEQADVGIVGIQLEDEHGRVARSCARFPVLSQFLAQATGLDRLRHDWGHAMREWDHGDTRRVPQVIGAFFLVRGTLFRQLGGFDERFFVYFEEVDLAYRAWQAGWASLYLAEARAFHRGGGTSDQVKAHRLFYSLRSRLAYFDKHAGFGARVGIRVVSWGLEPLSRLLLLLIGRRWDEVRALAQAYRMLWWSRA